MKTTQLQAAQEQACGPRGVERGSGRGREEGEVVVTATAEQEEEQQEG
jgi:hypothetical protein